MKISRMKISRIGIYNDIERDAMNFKRIDDVNTIVSSLTVVIGAGGKVLSVFIWINMIIVACVY